MFAAAGILPWPSTMRPMRPPTVLQRRRLAERLSAKSWRRSRDPSSHQWWIQRRCYLRSSRLGTDAIRLITAVSDPGEVAGLPHEQTKTRSPCQDDMLPSRAAWHWLSIILALRRPCFFSRASAAVLGSAPGQAGPQTEPSRGAAVRLGYPLPSPSRFFGRRDGTPRLRASTASCPCRKRLHRARARPLRVS